MSASESYKGISLFTIAPDEPLPFSVAVYYKGRYVPYREPGQAIEVSRYNRFVYKRIGTLFVPLSEFAKYEAYVSAKQAEEQRGLSDPALTPEKRLSNKIAHEMKHATRDVFMFDTEKVKVETVKRVLSITHNTVAQVLSKPYMRVFESVPETANDIVAHSTRVSLLATYLAYQCGYVNPVALEYLASAALLHDLGKTKISLSDDLNAGAESPAEAELMRQHPNLSCEMLDDMPFIPTEILRIIREHHEYRDGSGYPNGIRGPKMLGLSRIFVIANTFDNLVSEQMGFRSERHKRALQTMVSTMRSKLDPVLMSKVVKILGAP